MFSSKNRGLQSEVNAMGPRIQVKVWLDGRIDTRALQAYLGHRNTALAPDRFKGFWRD
jgi:hypothetical protein